MRWQNKITDKKAAYDFILANRGNLTLDEIGARLNVSKQRVLQICEMLGIKEKPYRPRRAALKSQVNVIACSVA